MASVTSLDKDLRNLRMDKYTPQRAKETLQWIESVLGERLGSPDLLEALKDGTALCRLANLALGQGTVRFKTSNMPFVQMENISHFLRTCQSPPLSLPPHDVFLTVDLYEQKDPAQVLQCIGAFSRKAAALQPSKFPTTLEGKKSSALSPQSSGLGASPGHSRGLSNTSSDAGRASPSKGFTASPPGASTWSQKRDIGNEAPAWNIAQYGWTGGASQGNQGVSFGARRQLVSDQPHVPSLAEKERRRKEKEVEAERQREAAADERRKLQAQIEEEERLAREEESRRWEEETKRQKEQERKDAEEEKKRWQEEERRWKEEEAQRLREEKEAETRMEKERNTRPVLHGQYLSQYRAGQQPGSTAAAASSESDRIKELERQLEEARERERKYESERQKLEVQKSGSTQAEAVPVENEPSPPAETKPPIEDEWDDRDTERGFLRQQWKKTQEATQPPRPLPVPGSQSSNAVSSRPLPVPGKASAPTPGPKPISTESTPEKAPTSLRPLPNPSTYVSSQQTSNRTETFLASNPAPPSPKLSTHVPSEAAFSSSAEQATEDSRRQASQQKTRAGGWASKSLLEREMEREREAQREWEENQKATKAAFERGEVDPNAGVGPGQSWDVNSYGYTGGDNLNKGGGGVYSGRRQIIGGPRPMNGK